MPPSSDFYQNLPLLTSFTEALKRENHHPVPADWFIALTDVVNSTEAIEKGDYKAVNTAGGLATIAISNVNKSMDFPFVFGGDGVSCLIPAHIANEVADVLFDTKHKVKEFFGLDLRVGLIPVKDLYQKGFQLELAKLKVSDYYEQAIIDGDGWSYAEDILKTNAQENDYLITRKKNENLEANFEGFTCRWQDIPSNQGETIATIIQLRGADVEKHLTELSKKIDHIFGKEEDFHPLSAVNLQVANSEKELGVEAKVFSQGSGLKYFLKLRWIKFESMLTKLALRFNLNVKVNWYNLSRLKEYQIAASDYKKYDGSLKMVLSSTSEQRRKWENYLEKAYQNGWLYYGIHIADRAVMTCLLHAGSKREVHFIDAADGGYTLAAKKMRSAQSVSSAFYYNPRLIVIRTLVEKPREFGMNSCF